VSTLAAHIPRTLIADDQPDVLAALRLLLKNEGYQTEAANSPNAVLEAVSKRQFDVALIDLNYARDTTSGQEGLDLISRIQAVDNSLPIVVMTAWGTVDLAVEAMRRGVRDFVQKPWENSRLLQVLRTQIEKGRTRRRHRVHASRRRARNHRFQSELKEARDIQRRWMPERAMHFEGFDVSCDWRSAGMIGGDYLAAFPLGNDRAGLCVADVAGKGLPAALMMSNMQAALKSAASDKLPPNVLCDQLNKLLCGSIPINRFVTCFYGLLDTRSRVLRFTNAGHNSPLLVRGAKVMSLGTGGKVLGAFADCTYSEGQIPLCSGDRLVLFTDGLTEVRNAVGDEFGEARLRELLVSKQRLNTRDLLSLILSRVSEFCGHQFDDDAALMIVTMK
jgi:sigma-B regulation protein RsbU (phosphoserine phosphatase)